MIEELEFIIQASGFDQRASLTMIIGYGKLLLTGDLGSLTEEQEQAIKIMGIAAKRVLEVNNEARDEMMILNLLHGRTKPDLTPIEIQEWLGNITGGFAKAIESKNQRLVIDVPKILYAKSDYYLCGKMMGYLIDNACRYTGEGGQITITSRLRSDDILITISDNGIGISVEEQARIFDKGFRGSHEVAQQSGGLGRGLYNARRLAEVLGCGIGVESEVGKGSTFWFTLPLAGDEEEE